MSKYIITKIQSECRRIDVSADNEADAMQSAIPILNTIEPSEIFGINYQIKKV